jgi:RimJ/RimL family protein N-acetyltransferase
MSEKSESLNFRPVLVQDLELLLAWRSNPDIYDHFKNQETALAWSDHVSWFATRDESRHDYIIEHKGRRVGSVYIDQKKYIGVYIGETSLQEKGIGSKAIEWITNKFNKPLWAEIKAENKASKKAFKKCGFEEVAEQNSWTKYKLE